MNTTHQHNIISFISFLAVIGFAGCSPGGSSLTDEVILAELHNHNYPHWYPQLSMAPQMQVSQKDPTFAECRRLVAEHYVEQPDGLGEYQITNKGKEVFLNRLNYNDIYHEYSFAFSPYIIDVAAISDRLIDSEHGTATIKYTLKRTPTDYAKHLMEIDPAFAKKLDDQYFEAQKTARFKRWDSGWRLESNQ